MQQAKKAAAMNWRATLSGDGGQMKNNIDRVQSENREQNSDPANDKNKRPVAEQKPAMEVQDRAQKDRSVTEQC